MNNKTKQFMTILCIVAGNAILAFGVAAFIIPHGFISGGVAGVALVLNHLVSIDIDIGIAIANIVLFLIGAIVIGKKFAIATLTSTILYPTFFAVFSRMDFVNNMTSDTLMAALYAGIFCGIGIGLVIKVGASTGGMDIPPIILNKYFGLSIPVMIYVCDTTLLLLQFPSSTSDQILYGILVVMLTSIVMDKIIIIGEKQTQVMIMSPKFEEINAAIHKNLDRGSTLLESVSGHLRKNQKVVLTIISNRQLNELNELVNSIDPDAFSVVTQVNEVKGRGFTLSKRNITPSDHLEA